MNKILMMLKMGWTEKQYYEENTVEVITQLTFVLEKMDKVNKFDSQTETRKANVKVKTG